MHAVTVYSARRRSRAITEQFENRTLKVKARIAGRRIDSYLAMKFPDYSRNAIQAAIAEGTIRVNRETIKPSYKIRTGDEIHICLPGATGPEIPPEDIPLDILYEDEQLVAINKPSDLVIHPARGHLKGTLVNALVHHFNQLSDPGDPLRPGILHRLDRYTSGVIVVAKQDQAHWKLARQWEERTVKKEYLAVVEGEPHLDEDTVDVSIGRHPRIREKMAVDPAGRESQTRYRVVERFGEQSLVHCFPRTGRTHQIRVHMLAIGCPILCDHMYGRRESITASELRGEVPTPGEPPLLSRQALHALRLELDHPVTGERMTIEAPVAPDIAAVLDTLRQS